MNLCKVVSFLLFFLSASRSFSHAVVVVSSTEEVSVVPVSMILNKRSIDIDSRGLGVSALLLFGLKCGSGAKNEAKQ